MGNRPKGEPPAYRRWKRRGEVAGYATFQNHRVPFPGPYNSPESRQAYERWRADWIRLNGQQAPQPPAGCDIGELILSFLRHAEQHYRRPDGSPTSEIANFKYSLRYLRRLHEKTPCNEFGPLDLEAVRGLMLREPVTVQTVHGPKVLRVGLSRGVANQYTGRIVRLFNWGMGKGLVRPEVVTALKGLQPLARGRSVARETPRVLPVEWATVEATLPWLACDQLRAMVRLQWWTGCRPGQACAIRGEDVYQSGVVELGRKRLTVPEGCWLWAIDAKMAHLRGDEDREEVYPLNARAQEVLTPWLKESGYLFATNRSERYTGQSYAHAVRDALRKAAGAGTLIPRWWAHRIRHSVAARVQALRGLEAARAVLNHRDVSLTREYGARDLALAAEAMTTLAAEK